MYAYVISLSLSVQIIIYVCAKPLKEVNSENPASTIVNQLLHVTSIGAHSKHLVPCSEQDERWAVLEHVTCGLNGSVHTYIHIATCAAVVNAQP